MSDYGPPLRVTDPLTGIEYDSNGEDWRFICECRGWLNRGYFIRSRIEQLREKLKHRDPNSVDRLIDGMREQYRIMKQQREERAA